MSLAGRARSKRKPTCSDFWTQIYVGSSAIYQSCGSECVGEDRDEVNPGQRVNLNWQTRAWFATFGHATLCFCSIHFPRVDNRSLPWPAQRKTKRRGKLPRRQRTPE